MTKAEFLQALEGHLLQMPVEEREKQLDYYSELVDDMVEDGMSEEQAVERLGDPEEIARELLQSLPLSTLIRGRVRTDRKKDRRGWQTVLNVLGFPLWFLLLAAALIVVLSLYVSVWAVVVSLFAALAAAGIACVALAAAAIFGGAAALPVALLLIGGALLGLGLCLLGFFAMIAAAKGLLKLTGRLVRWIKSWFIQKER